MRVVTTLGLTTLGAAGCDTGKDDMRTANPPPPPPPETATAAPTPVIARNPPAPTPPPDPPSDLPSWDDVGSGHPEGATNPPSAVLQLHPDGRCFKSWEGGFAGPPRDATPKTFGENTFLVRVLPADAKKIRGRQINCPDGAAEGLEDDA
ncbi:MAG: hypothetical protein RIF41_20445, partial [Polyangiaceae bacterium]